MTKYRFLQFAHTLVSPLVRIKPIAQRMYQTENVPFNSVWWHSTLMQEWSSYAFVYKERAKDHGLHSSFWHSSIANTVRYLRRLHGRGSHVSHTVRFFIYVFRRIFGRSPVRRIMYLGKDGPIHRVCFLLISVSLWLSESWVSMEPLVGLRPCYRI